MQVAPCSVDEADVRALVELHQRRMYAASPPGTSFALDVDGLRDPAILLAAAREGGALLGVGALKVMAGGLGELKSMRTTDGALRRGVAQALLEWLAIEARAAGCSMLVLETGTGEHFAAANAFYARNGFVRRGPFGDYVASDFNIFYQKAL